MTHHILNLEMHVKNAVLWQDSHGHMVKMMGTQRAMQHARDVGVYLNDS